jgi:hypothetical protein
MNIFQNKHLKFKFKIKIKINFSALDSPHGLSSDYNSGAFSLTFDQRLFQTTTSTTITIIASIQLAKFSTRCFA